jgi:predicted anti-sigma-YlaC factor YlaD
MTLCTDTRELLSAYLEGELDVVTAAEVRSHLETCSECSELISTLEMIGGALGPFSELHPPAHLEQEISSSPCRRWLGLLFRAVDRELPDSALERLLTHLESCESCRNTWQDLTIIHQVGEALEPPAGLVQRCIGVRFGRKRRRLMGKRMATAAAYLLAVLTSLVIGNPVTLARHEAAGAVQAVTETVASGVSEAALEGRGEARVILWRAWQWTNRQIEAAQQLVSELSDDTDSEEEQGGQT